MDTRDTVGIVLCLTGDSGPRLLNSRTVSVTRGLTPFIETTIRDAHRRCFHPLPHDNPSLKVRLIETIQLIMEYRVFTLMCIRGRHRREFILDDIIGRLHGTKLEDLVPIKIRSHPNFRWWISRARFEETILRTPCDACFLMLYGRPFSDTARYMLEIGYANRMAVVLITYLCMYMNSPSNSFQYLSSRLHSAIYGRELHDSQWVCRVVMRARPRPSIVIAQLRMDHLNDQRDAPSLYWRLRMYVECMDGWDPRYEARVDRIVFGRGRPILSELYVRAKLNLGINGKYGWNVILRYDESWRYCSINRIGLPI